MGINQDLDKMAQERIAKLAKQLADAQETLRTDCALDDKMLIAIGALPDEVLPEAIDRVVTELKDLKDQNLRLDDVASAARRYLDLNQDWTRENLRSALRSLEAHIREE